MFKLLKKPQKNQTLINDFCEQGYTELKNQYFSKEFYRKTYNAFDNVIELFSEDPSSNNIISNVEKDFGNHFQAIFSGAPTGYRDCRKIATKKDQKIYFQFCKEFYSLMLEKYSEVLIKFDILRVFFESLSTIDEKAKILFNQAIDNLEHDVSGLRDVLFRNRENLTVITRILRYESNHQFCTSPHYDKSGLTLVLDNSDLQNDKFRIGPHMKNFDMSLLLPPNRQFDGYKNSTSTLLFPGACLKKIGLNINPTPHVVLPSETRRYAIVVFCLVPHIDTKDIQTTIINKTELSMYNREH